MSQRVLTTRGRYWIHRSKRQPSMKTAHNHHHLPFTIIEIWHTKTKWCCALPWTRNEPPPWGISIVLLWTLHPHFRERPKDNGEKKNRRHYWIREVEAHHVNNLEKCLISSHKCNKRGDLNSISTRFSLSVIVVVDFFFGLSKKKEKRSVKVWHKKTKNTTRPSLKIIFEKEKHKFHPHL